MPSILNNSSAPLTNASIASSFTSSLLSVGRQISGAGGKVRLGLSSGARAGIDGFISATQSGYNQLFSLATGPSLSVEGLQAQIKGLRASIPKSQLSDDVLQQMADDNADNGAAAASSTVGTNVDTSA